uniref:RING-type domain-containing protein n=1 Tax=Entamoeba invadens TaxID=33085 RepID=S0B3W6_ENTIV|nr:hypothetical protein [Entamoeba invadens]
MSKFQLFPQQHPSKVPKIIRDWTQSFKTGRSKAASAFHNRSQRLEGLIQLYKTEKRVPHNESAIFGTCAVCGQSTTVLGKICSCCGHKLCARCIFEVKLKPKTVVGEVVKIKLYLCCTCYDVYNVMKASQVLQRVQSDDHFNIEIRARIIEAAGKVIAIKKGLDNATDKETIIHLCEDGQKTIKQLHSVVDSLKKENHSFQYKSDAVVESNMIRALANFSGTFGFYLVGQIEKTEKRMQKKLPLPVIKTINMCVIPKNGSVVVLTGVGLAGGVIAKIGKQTFQTKFLNGSLSVAIPPVFGKLSGDPGGLELYTADQRKISFPGDLLFCDY